MARFFTLLLLIVAANVQAQPNKWEPVRPGNVRSPYDVARVSAEPIRVAPIVSSEWRCLEQPIVLQELKLVPVQLLALDALSKPEALSMAIYAASFGRIELRATRELAAQLREEFLKSNLTKEQQQRLRQVVYQLKEREFGAHAAFAMAAKDLRLSADQMDDVTSIKGQRVEEIAKLVTSGERYEKVKKQVEAANGDTFDKMAEMLTRAQRERLQELKGKTFEAKVEFDPPPPTAPAAKYPAYLFGVYDFELRYLQTAEVRAELKLTDEQAKKVADAGSEWFKRWGTINKDSALAFHDDTEQAVTKILSKEQLDRLHQISMQVRARGGPEAVCGHPAAVAALKLTPIQLKQLSEGKSVGEVLTGDQQKAREQLLGQAFLFMDALHNPYLPVPIGREARVATSFARGFLVISDRLRLSEAQIKRLRELAEDEPKLYELIQSELSFTDTPPVLGAARLQTSGSVVTDRFRAAVEQHCFSVLDERQQSMARQIFGIKRPK